MRPGPGQDEPKEKEGRAAESRETVEARETGTGGQQHESNEQRENEESRSEEARQETEPPRSNQSSELYDDDTDPRKFPPRKKTRMNETEGE